MRGLTIAGRTADERYHFGYAKAESVATAAVAVMLVVAAVGISIQAIREILTPHHVPAPYTLVVLVAVIATKETLFRRVLRAGSELGSLAVKADAWHHRSDAITSAAAFVGIAVALIGGPDWAEADDWAALLASGLIAWNGYRLLRPALDDLMDRAPDAEVILANVRGRTRRLDPRDSPRGPPLRRPFAARTPRSSGDSKAKNLGSFQGLMYTWGCWRR